MRNMIPANPDELNDLVFAATAETMANPDQQFVLNVDVTTLSMVIGLMQLALRHPNFKNPEQAETSRRSRAVVDAFIDSVPEHMPKTRELLLKGYDQGFDV